MPQIRSVRCRDFKRFSNLNIANIPQCSLVVLLGPNGCGKSSLFDVFNAWANHQKHPHWEDGYYSRDLVADNQIALLGRIDIEVHGDAKPLTKVRKAEAESTLNKYFYFRSAYRQMERIQLYQLQQQGSALDDDKGPRNAVAIDQRLSGNFLRILSDSVSRLYDPRFSTQSAAQICGRLVGSVRASMQRVFGADLFLDDLGVDPFTSPHFTFSKGTSKKYDYKNLSAGERAAFDLILDMAIKSETFDDTVYCIDEPELHLHSKLHGIVLRELLELLPKNDLETQRASQLWIASHSIGFLKEALDLSVERPGEVVFLDFGDRDFDSPVTLEPANVDRRLWKKTFAVALHDLADLVAPKQIIICEGKPLVPQGAGDNRNASFDARIYTQIFEATHPDTAFVSGGNCEDVVRDAMRLGAAFSATIPGVTVRKLIDRDNRSQQSLEAIRRGGDRVLSRYSIENYLWSDEILTSLLNASGCSTQELEHILSTKARLLDKQSGEPEGDLDYVKDISGQIYAECRKISPLRGHGNNASDFAIHALAPRITSDTETYRALERDIFPEATLLTNQ